VTPLVVEGEVSRFDVSLFAWDLPGGLAGTAEYCADLLDRSTVVRMLEDLETLVRAIVVDPEAPLSALDRCLGEAARARRRAIEQVYHDAIDERLRTIRRMPGLPSS
jgi:non-ribosomal peptide synthetase component F